MNKKVDLVKAKATDGVKVKRNISKSRSKVDPSQNLKKESTLEPVPVNYICYRCGVAGHFIRNCPTRNVSSVKRSTGIPKSYLVVVDGPEHKGALLTSSGQYAVPLIDLQTYSEEKQENPPQEEPSLVGVEDPPQQEPSLVGEVFPPQQELPAAEPKVQLPEELVCKLCQNLLQNAVLIPCCGSSFCYECVQQYLLQSYSHLCPECQKSNISLDKLVPNCFVQTAVSNFLNEKGYLQMNESSHDIFSSSSQDQGGRMSVDDNYSQALGSINPVFSEQFEVLNPVVPVDDNSYNQPEMKDHNIQLMSPQQNTERAELLNNICKEIYSMLYSNKDHQSSYYTNHELDDNTTSKDHEMYKQSTHSKYDTNIYTASHHNNERHRRPYSEKEFGNYSAGSLPVYYSDIAAQPDSPGVEAHSRLSSPHQHAANNYHHKSTKKSKRSTGKEMKDSHRKHRESHGEHSKGQDYHRSKRCHSRERHRVHSKDDPYHRHKRSHSRDRSYSVSKSSSHFKPSRRLSARRSTETSRSNSPLSHSRSGYSRSTFSSKSQTHSRIRSDRSWSYEMKQRESRETPERIRDHLQIYEKRVVYFKETR